MVRIEEETAMDDTAESQYRERLLRLRDDQQALVQAINETGLSMSMSEQFSEDAVYDNHPGDMGSEMFERAKDLGLRWHAWEQIGAIDRALRALNEGRYGICEQCGKPIPPERLEVMPHALQCVACRQAEEDRPDTNMRPVEEQVLEPVFGRTNKDGADYAGFDGEDAFQAVAAYGTSESPSDLPGAVDYDDLYHSDERIGGVDAVELLIDEHGEPLQ